MRIGCCNNQRPSRLTVTMTVTIPSGSNGKRIFRDIAVQVYSDYHVLVICLYYCTGGAPGHQPSHPELRERLTGLREHSPARIGGVNARAWARGRGRLS